MRDAMPGPGWWIASDGRWYPPELHPDMRAPAAVILEDESTIGPEAHSSNGQHVSEHAGNGVLAAAAAATVDAPETDGVETRNAIEANANPPRRRRQRLAIGVSLALVTLALIIYVARGHDDRPSLQSQVATNATTAAAQTAPSTSVAGAGAPGATAATG